MKVGLLFGSFNPLHWGHLIVARYWLNETDLDQLWLVVSPHNPHKRLEELVPVQHRLAMARAAVADEAALQVSAVEMALPQPSYTIHTLRYLQSAQPDWQWILLLGADAAAALPTWKEGETILADWEIWVYPRRGTSEKALPTASRLQFFAQAPLIELSATQIRHYRRQGKSIRYLVPPAVEAYILAHALYSAESAHSG
ncbi:MAG: nicotinate (nicotinamide) nucleotide adenylyltransferase [Bacteroidia bacterium]|nr:nicotinate (nicotinamide) nucleotide adenylyltransferase [Bacteroidia bacterium]MDW8088864.1 nicotinate (nicotinamide) nucleotide adenylyltransferase [Bacteroidia bacterium]